ncbi:hypothetical protein AB0K11_10840 [Mycobacterium sp. NPDC050551]|uniref:hypothetical protein n=1 Tax=Mycobacterium sp. NPDC050551 TaxID=3155407 RepID=UPI0034479EB2
MRSQRRYLAWGLVAAAVPMSVIVTAPPAVAQCTSTWGTSVCAQGGDSGPRVLTPVVPYPCDYDWYCDTDSDVDIAWNPDPPDRPDRPIDPGRPGRPNRPGGGG